MGTRGSYGFVLGGERIQVYNHFDSYPSGLGDDVVSFLLEEFGKNGYDDAVGLLKQRVRSMEAIDRNVRPTEAQKKFLEPYMDLRVSNQSTDDWYCLLRNTQGNIEDTLSARYYESNDCGDGEYSYMINLDDETLEFSGYVADRHKFPLKSLSEATVSEMEAMEDEEEEV